MLQRLQEQLFVVVGHVLEPSSKAPVQPAGHLRRDRSGDRFPDDVMRHPKGPCLLDGNLAGHEVRGGRLHPGHRPALQRRSFPRRQRPPRQRKHPEQGGGVRPDLGHPVGDQGAHAGGGLPMGRELVQPERRAFGPVPHLGRADGVQCRRELHGQPDAGFAAQGAQRDLHEPAGLGHDPTEGSRKGPGGRGGARGANEGQRQARHLGGAG